MRSERTSAEAADRHVTSALTASGRVTAEGALVDLNRSPWGRLYLDMANNPLFENEDRLTLLRVVGFGARVAHSFAPSWTLDFAEFVRKGGLSGVVSWVKVSRGA